tara:strand:+ start:53286 stop:53798 length:513 start_codon:yes stop_codon:yes gene_type:complete
MKKLLLVIFLLKISFFVAQSISINPPVNYFEAPFGRISNGHEKIKILKVIDQFMQAVNSKDKEIFNKILYKGINRIVTNIDNDSIRSTIVIDNDSSIANRMDPNKKEDFRERYWDANVITDGNIASVWAPYDFYLNGSFSHCGVDLFYLVKDDDAWKIAHFGYTRNKECK